MTKLPLSILGLLVAGAACSSANPKASDSIPALGGSTGSGGSPATGGSTASGGATQTGGSATGGKPVCASLSGLPSGCGVAATEARFRPVSILLVVDKSSSMSLGQDIYGLSKWQALRMALSNAISQVTSGVAIGLELYPAPEVAGSCGSTDCCTMPAPDSTIEVPVAIGSAAQIQTVLQSTNPSGATPTAEALRRAADYFTTGAGASITGQKVVLLATDGAPNCGGFPSCEAGQCTLNIEGSTGCTPTGTSCCTSQGVSCLDDVAAQAAVQNLATNGIATVVVGIPGSEAYVTVLQNLASAALAPAQDVQTYYQISTAAGLQGLSDTIQAITTDLVKSCAVPLSEAPPDPDQVNVAVDCVVVTMDMADGSGWRLDDTSSPPTLVLESEVCTEITQQGARRIDTVFGCPTVN
jgi:hypothetical protein